MKNESKANRIFFVLFSLLNLVCFNVNSQSSCYCEGRGNYTMVFDAGMGNWSVFFKPLGDELKKKYRVCYFNRHDYLKKKRPTQKSLKELANDLNELLIKNKIKDSIILVGHSLGGLHVRMYADLYPMKVKGVILLDAAHPNLLDSIPLLKNNLAEQSKQIEKVINLAKWGLLRFGKKNIPTFGLPKQYLKEYYKVTTRKKYYLVYQSEMNSFENIIKESKSLKGLGEIPVLVIGSKIGLNPPIKSNENDGGTTSATWINLQRDLSKLSFKSIYIETEADHFFHISQTEMVVNEIEKFKLKFIGPHE